VHDAARDVITALIARSRYFDGQARGLFSALNNIKRYPPSRLLGIADPQGGDFTRYAIQPRKYKRGRKIRESAILLAAAFHRSRHQILNPRSRYSKRRSAECDQVDLKSAR